MFLQWLNTCDAVAFYLIYLISADSEGVGRSIDANWIGTTRPIAPRRGLLGVHPATLRSVHVWLLPDRLALARTTCGWH